MKVPTKHGEIELKEEEIVISDNAMLGNKFSLGLYVLLLLVGLRHLIGWLTSDLTVIPYTYIFVFLTALFLVIRSLRFTPESIIKYAEIDHVKFTKRPGNHFTDIVLKNKKIRRMGTTLSTHKTLSGRVDKVAVLSIL